MLPSEILQKIAEDLDRVASPGSDARIVVGNSFQHGLPSAQLMIMSQYTDKTGAPKMLEKVVWQTDYDLATGRLMLYRCHSGLLWEDTLLDYEQRHDWSPDRQLFVPLCTGISYFKIQVPQPQNLVQKAEFLNQTSSRETQDQGKLEEQQFLDAWNQPQLPPAITVTISFASPIEDKASGAAEISEEFKIKHTVVIDRSKKMNFVYVPLPDMNHPDVNKPQGSDSSNANDAQKRNSGNMDGYGTADGSGGGSGGDSGNFGGGSGNRAGGNGRYGNGGKGGNNTGNQNHYPNHPVRGRRPR